MNTIQKVIVVSIPRTGSTLICEMLAQHPAILGFGEIFIHEEASRRGFHEAGAGDTRCYPGEHKLPEYLAYLEAIARLEDKTHLTFKLMDYQEPALWDMIAADSSIGLIYARRKDVLECVASALAGAESGVWHGHTPEDIERAAKVKVVVPFMEWFNWQARFKALNEHITSVLKNPLHIVEYEDLSANPEKCADNLFDFLCLPRIPVKITQQKLNNRPLAERVTNYHELTQLATAMATPH